MQNELCSDSSNENLSDNIQQSKSSFSKFECELVKRDFETTCKKTSLPPVQMARNIDREINLERKKIAEIENQNKKLYFKFQKLKSQLSNDINVVKNTKGQIADQDFIVSQIIQIEKDILYYQKQVQIEKKIKQKDEQFDLNKLKVKMKENEEQNNVLQNEIRELKTQKNLFKNRIQKLKKKNAMIFVYQKECLNIQTK